MNLLELLTELRQKERIFAATPDGRLLIFPKGDKTRLPESIRLCIARYKPALMDVAIQRGQIVQKVNGKYQALSDVERENFTF